MNTIPGVLTVNNQIGAAALNRVAVLNRSFTLTV